MKMFLIVVLMFAGSSGFFALFNLNALTYQRGFFLGDPDRTMGMLEFRSQTARWVTVGVSFAVVAPLVLAGIAVIARR